MTSEAGASESDSLSARANSLARLSRSGARLACARLPAQRSRSPRGVSVDPRPCALYTSGAPKNSSHWPMRFQAWRYEIPAASAACVSLPSDARPARSVTSRKSNSRSASPARKRQTGRMSMRIMRAIIAPGPSGSRLARVGEKQLLAADPVVGDRLLAPGRDHPVDELLAGLLLHVRMLLRAHQHDAVLVE